MNFVHKKSSIFQDTLIKFVYTDSVYWDKLTPDLLTAADKYDIPALSGHCCRRLSQTLSIANAARFFLLGYFMVSATILKKAAMRFIVDNYDFVKKTPEWAVIVGQHPKALEEIFEFSCKRS